MKLHYNKHHTAYVSNLNAYTEKYAMAVEAGDVQAQIVLQQMMCVFHHPSSQASAYILD